MTTKDAYIEAKFKDLQRPELPELSDEQVKKFKIAVMQASENMINTVEILSQDYKNGSLMYGKDLDLVFKKSGTQGQTFLSHAALQILHSKAEQLLLLAQQTNDESLIFNLTTVNIEDLLTLAIGIYNTEVAKNISSATASRIANTSELVLGNSENSYIVGLATIKNVHDLLKFYDQINCTNLSYLGNETEGNLGIMRMPENLQDIENYIHERQILLAKNSSGEIVGLSEYRWIEQGLSFDELHSFIQSIRHWAPNNKNPEQTARKYLSNPDNLKKVAMLEQLKCLPEIEDSGLILELLKETEKEMLNSGIAAALCVIPSAPLDLDSMNFYYNQGWQFAGNADILAENTTISAFSLNGEQKIRLGVFLKYLK